MSDLIWVDPRDRITSARTHRKALKRHIYETENGRFQRICGSVDKSGKAPSSRDELVREESTKYAGDKNACRNCLETSGLDEVAEHLESRAGAEKVDYDPFGVFDGDDDE